MTLYYTYFILCTSCDRLSRLPPYAFPHAHLDTFSITSLSKSPAPCFHWFSDTFAIAFSPYIFNYTLPHLPLHHATSFAASLGASLATYQLLIKLHIPLHLLFQFLSIVTPVVIILHLMTCVAFYQFYGFQTPPLWCN